MKKSYLTPDAELIRLTAVRTLWVSADDGDNWKDDPIPEDDETELM